MEMVLLLACDLLSRAGDAPAGGGVSSTINAIISDEVSIEVADVAPSALEEARLRRSWSLRWRGDSNSSPTVVALG